MSDKTVTARGRAAAAKPALTYKRMTPLEKGVHWLKVVGFLATFGFVFPTVLEEF